MNLEIGAIAESIIDICVGVDDERKVELVYGVTQTGRVYLWTVYGQLLKFVKVDLPGKIFSVNLVNH
jgi:hypothetical protein